MSPYFRLLDTRSLSAKERARASVPIHKEMMEVVMVIVLIIIVIIYIIEIMIITKTTVHFCVSEYVCKCVRTSSDHVSPGMYIGSVLYALTHTFNIISVVMKQEE